MIPILHITFKCKYAVISIIMMYRPLYFELYSYRIHTTMCDVFSLYLQVIGQLQRNYHICNGLLEAKTLQRHSNTVSNNA